MDYASKRQKAGYNALTNHSIRYMDYSLFFIVLLLLGFGLVSLYSASALYASNKGLNSLFFAKRQAIYMAAGLAVMAVLIRLDL